MNQQNYLTIIAAFCGLVTVSNGQSDNPCTSEGFFRDPQDCGRFYRCVRFEGIAGLTVYRFACPDGLVWDETHDTCNWPNAAPPCDDGQQRGQHNSHEKTQPLDNGNGRESIGSESERNEQENGFENRRIPQNNGFNRRTRPSQSGNGQKPINDDDGQWRDPQNGSSDVQRPQPNEFGEDRQTLDNGFDSGQSIPNEFEQKDQSNEFDNGQSNEFGDNNGQRPLPNDAQSEDEQNDRVEQTFNTFDQQQHIDGDDERVQTQPKPQRTTVGQRSTRVTQRPTQPPRKGGDDDNRRPPERSTKRPFFRPQLRPPPSTRKPPSKTRTTVGQEIPSSRKATFRPRLPILTRTMAVRVSSSTPDEWDEIQQEEVQQEREQEIANDQQMKEHEEMDQTHDRTSTKSKVSPSKVSPTKAPTKGGVKGRPKPSPPIVQQKEMDTKSVKKMRPDGVKGHVKDPTQSPSSTEASSTKTTQSSSTDATQASSTETTPTTPSSSTDATQTQSSSTEPSSTETTPSSSTDSTQTQSSTDSTQTQSSSTDPSKSMITDESQNQTETSSTTEKSSETTEMSTKQTDESTTGTTQMQNDTTEPTTQSSMQTTASMTTDDSSTTEMMTQSMNQTEATTSIMSITTESSNDTTESTSESSESSSESPSESTSETSSETSATTEESEDGGTTDPLSTAASSLSTSLSNTSFSPIVQEKEGLEDDGCNCQQLGPSFKCTAEGSFRDPFDCNKFYKCTVSWEGEGFDTDAYQCNDGTVLDEDSETCKPPSETVPCQMRAMSAKLQQNGKSNGKTNGGSTKMSPRFTPRPLTSPSTKRQETKGDANKGAANKGGANKGGANKGGANKGAANKGGENKGDAKGGPKFTPRPLPSTKRIQSKDTTKSKDTNGKPKFTPRPLPSQSTKRQETKDVTKSKSTNGIPKFTPRPLPSKMTPASKVRESSVPSHEVQQKEIDDQQDDHREREESSPAPPSSTLEPIVQQYEQHHDNGDDTSQSTETPIEQQKNNGNGNGEDIHEQQKSVTEDNFLPFVSTTQSRVSKSPSRFSTQPSPEQPIVQQYEDSNVNGHANGDDYSPFESNSRVKSLRRTSAKPFAEENNGVQYDNEYGDASNNPDRFRDPKLNNGPSHDEPSAEPISKSNFVCTDEGFYRDPEDCNAFFRCVRNPRMIRYDFRCGDGLYFDEKYSVCNWPNSASPPCLLAAESSINRETIVKNENNGDEQTQNKTQFTPRPTKSSSAAPRPVKNGGKSVQQLSPNGKGTNNRPVKNGQTKGNKKPVNQSKGPSSVKNGQTQNNRTTKRPVLQSKDQPKPIDSNRIKNKQIINVPKFNPRPPLRNQRLIAKESNGGTNHVNGRTTNRQLSTRKPVFNPRPLRENTGQRSNGIRNDNKQRPNVLQTSESKSQLKNTTKRSESQRNAPNRGENRGERPQPATNGRRSVINGSKRSDSGSHGLVSSVKRHASESKRSEKLKQLSERPINGHFKCKNSGYFRDPNDCSKYYRCVRNPRMMQYEYKCSDGLYFDETFNVCNWPLAAQPPCHVLKSRDRSETNYKSNSFDNETEESRVIRVRVTSAKQVNSTGNVPRVPQIRTMVVNEQPKVWTKYGPTNYAQWG